MRKLIYLIFGILLFILSGCGVSSIHPLYTEQDVIFDPALLGDWTDKDSKGTSTFTKSGDKVYNLEIILSYKFKIYAHFFKRVGKKTI